MTRSTQSAVAWNCACSSTTTSLRSQAARSTASAISTVTGSAVAAQRHRLLNALWPRALNTSTTSAYIRYVSWMSRTRSSVTSSKSQMVTRLQRHGSGRHLTTCPESATAQVWAWPAASQRGPTLLERTAAVRSSTSVTCSFSTTWRLIGSPSTRQCRCTLPRRHVQSRLASRAQRNTYWKRRVTARPCCAHVLISRVRSTLEQPTLVAPWLHGVPHQVAAPRAAHSTKRRACNGASCLPTCLHVLRAQSVDEVLAGLLTGRPPKRWAHVYTGNHVSDQRTLCTTRPH
jgi:hypothetical protein